MISPTDDVGPVAVVPVKSAWASKVNWTQAISMVAMVASYFTGGKINLTPDQQTALAVAIGVVTNVVTIIIKSYFTPTVTVGSLTKG